jgi:PAS domain S-box-containing protein
MFPVEVNLRAIESDGRWLMVAIGRDITQRKKVEQQLSDGEERFRQLAENIQDVFWIRDVALDKIIYASPAFETIWGSPVSILYEHPRTFIDAVHPEDKARVIEAFIRQREQQVWFNEEFRVCRPDGTVRWIWSRAFPVYDAHGAVYRIAGIAEDVTSQKQAEFALRQSEETSRLLIEHAPVGIALVGRDYKFSGVNQALCAMLGYAAQEFYTLTFADITHPDDVQADLVMAKKLFGGEIPSYTMEKRYLRKNGEVFWIHMIATIIHDQDGQPLYGMGIIEDITARREAEAQQMVALEMQRDALVREVHHRIKNNLQGVVGLMRQYATEHTAVAALVNDIASKIFAVAVVHGLQSRYTTEEIELSDMLDEIGQTVASTLGKVCTPHPNKEPALSARINRNEAVPVALILNELLVNACKHGHDDTAPPDVSIALLHDGDVLSIRITNTLMPGQQDFDFATNKGLGTGLTLVKSLLPRQGATLQYHRDAQHLTAELQLSAPVIVLTPPDPHASAPTTA